MSVSVLNKQWRRAVIASTWRAHNALQRMTWRLSSTTAKTTTTSSTNHLEEAIISSNTTIISPSTPVLSPNTAVILPSTITAIAQTAEPDVLKWKKIRQLQRLPLGIYLELSKARLASLVTLTTMVGVAMAPTSPSIATLLLTTAGTALCISSANTFNQLIESPYDAQMSRTRNRPLVQHAVSETHAATFAVVTATVGVSTLCFVNPLTAVLGATNIVLYSFIYTPMKRISIYNTWVGAMVGAIPPMMGWIACTGTLSLGTGPDSDLGAYALGFFLYAWQFPHFNSLSWAIREDYSKAGYHMAAVTDPRLNARVSFRYALTLSLMPFITTYMDLTIAWFIWTSAPFNALMAYRAYRFYKRPDDKFARDLFFASIVHLPVVLMLMMAFKKERNIRNDVDSNESGNTRETFQCIASGPDLSSRVVERG